MPFTTQELAEELAIREAAENRRRGITPPDNHARPGDFRDLPEEPTEFLIWSEEHMAWWRPGGLGYTGFMRDAGRFSKEKAESICREANFDQNFNECPVPLTSVMAQAMELKGRGR